MGEMNISPTGDMNISPREFHGRHEHLSHAWDMNISPTESVGGMKISPTESVESMKISLANWKSCFILLLKTHDQRFELEATWETIKEDIRDAVNNVRNCPN